MSSHEQLTKIPHKPPSVRRALMMLMVAAGTLTTEPSPLNEGHDAALQAQEEAELKAQKQATKALAQREQKCNTLTSRKDRLPKLAWKRARILRELARIGTCTDPHAITFNTEIVCSEITRGLESKKPKWRHPILLPFYTLLYEELRCAHQDNNEQLDDYWLNLANAIKDNVISVQKQYPLLNPDTTLQSLCKPGIALIKENKRDIITLSAYIISLNEPLPPTLKKILDRTKKNFVKKNNREPSMQELQAVIESSLHKAAATASIAWLVCSFSIEKIVKKFSKTLTLADIQERRKEVLPLLRELAILFAKDAAGKEPNPKAADAAKSLMAILARVGNTYPR